MNIAQQSPAFVDSYSSDEVERTYRKLTLRLMPFLIICYIVSYLDRANISFANMR